MTQCLLKKVSLILGIVVVVLFLLLQKSCERVADIENNLLASDIEVEIWRDKQGRSHAKTQQLSSSIQALKITHRETLDSLKDTISDLKLKNLESVISVDAEVKDDVVLPVSPSGDFHFTDNFTFFDGVVLNDTLKMSYRIKTPIKLVSYKAKEKFFSFRKTSYVEAVSENPNVSFTGITKIKVSNRPRKIGFGFNASYGVGKYGLGFHLGIGLQYRIL